MQVASETTALCSTSNQLPYSLLNQTAVGEPGGRSSKAKTARGIGGAQSCLAPLYLSLSPK